MPELQPIPFGIQSYQHRSKPVSIQRCVNWYVESSQGSGSDRSLATLLDTPGLTLFSTSGIVAPGYGAHYFDREDLVYYVVGDRVFTLNSAGTSTQISTIGTNQSAIQIEDNGFENIILQENGAGYVASSGAVTQITDSNFIDISTITVLDGFVIASQRNSNKMICSALNNALVYPASNFANAEASPDVIVRVYASLKELIVFGSRTTEFWFNAGNIDFPFEPIQGTVMQRGCGAKLSVASENDTVCWLGDDRIVYMLDGYSNKKISNYGMDSELRKYQVVSDAVGRFYSEEGHWYYCLKFPSEGKEWVCDVTGGLIWHERESQNYNGWRVTSIVNAFGKNLAWDAEDGNVYDMSILYGDEAGTSILRYSISPIIWDSFNRVIHNAFLLDVETGNADLDEAPEILLSYSDDAGRTWSNNLPRSAGLTGQYKEQLIWNGLGASNNRVYKISYNGKAFLPVLSAYVNIDVGLRI